MDLKKNPELAHVTIYEATMRPGDEWYTPIASAHGMIHLNSPTINSVIKWVDKAHEPAVKRLCDEMQTGTSRIGCGNRGSGGHRHSIGLPLAATLAHYM